MAPESENNLRLEIGHALFLDIVGYSKLLIEEQKERLGQLTDIVLATAQVREATNEQLVRLPTGDGMALVFRNSSEEPARCSLEIARALKDHPEIALRMGIHSGPVSEVTDLNGRTNIAGAGINMAQRVMDCGDAGHILLSQRVAEDLAQYRQWAPCLHDLGECEVKHGVRLHVVNLYTGELGNSAVPEKLQQPGQRHATLTIPALLRSAGWPLKVAFVLAPLFLLGAIWLWHDIGQLPSKTPATGTRSLAVLPLKNLSGDPAEDYFADGVTDSLTTDLSHIHSLRVVSFQSVQQYKGERKKGLPEIARELNVDVIVEGSVQKSSDTVMINAQLVQARTDQHLWAERYTRNARDMLNAQNEIVLAITDAIKVQLTPKERSRFAKVRSVDPEAQSHYFQGRFQFGQGTQASFRQAIVEYEQAIRKDPGFAPAYAGIADCYSSLSSFSMPPRDAMPKAEAAARQALEIDPDLAEAHSALGYINLFYHWNREEAEHELLRAIDLNPNYSTARVNYGTLLLTLARFEDAVKQLRKAQDLEPTSALISCQLEWALFLSGNYDQVITQAMHTLVLEPTMSLSYSQMGLAYLYRGDQEKALTALKQAVVMEASSLNTTNYAVGLALSGQAKEAERVLNDFLSRSKGNYVCAYEVASAYEGMKDRPKALEWLKRGHDEKCDCLVWGSTEPWMGDFRKDPRYKAILAKTGLLQ